MYIYYPINQLNYDKHLHFQSLKQKIYMQNRKYPQCEFKIIYIVNYKHCLHAVCLQLVSELTTHIQRLI
jgi:hypothetical protein